MSNNNIRDEGEISALAKIVDDYVSENDMSINGFAADCEMSFSASRGVMSGEAHYVRAPTLKKVAKGMGISQKDLREQIAAKAKTVEANGAARKKTKKKAARRASISSVSLPEGLELAEDVPVVILGRMRLVAIDRIIKGDDAKEAIKAMELG